MRRHPHVHSDPSEADPPAPSDQLDSTVGLLFGIPLGVALGRTLWQVVADSTPLHYVPPLAFWALVLIVPLALVIVNLLAAFPGQRAARLPVNQILRAE